MRKLDLLKKISAVDDKLLAMSDCKIHPELLTMKDLKKVLDAFQTLYEMFNKCAEKQ